MTYKFNSKLEKFENSKIWRYHFRIPKKIAQTILTEGKRVVIVINNDVSYQCALMSAGDYGYFVNVNASIRKKVKINLFDRVSLEIRNDNSKYGLPVPKVFQELLKQDPNFTKVFESLSMGKQRSLIHLVGTFKTEQKQLEKLMTIRDYLNQVQGKLDYKELHQAFKNNRYQ